MHLFTRLCCSITLVAASVSSQAETPDQAAMEQFHQSINVGYATLTTETGALLQTASSYCAEPTTRHRDALGKAWLDAFLAWQAVRFVDFGPVENNNLAWQFQFWPDPKNLVARKAKTILKAEAPITSNLIEQSGVAVQGFPMIEFLLFDEQQNVGQDALPAPRSCDLLIKVAEHVNHNSEALAGQWSDFRPHYLANALYQETTLKAGMTALEILEERRLAQPMGLRGNGRRNPYIADAWRSGNSLKAAEAGVAGLQNHFLPGLTTLLDACGESTLASRIRAQFNKVADNFPAADAPMQTLLGDDDRFRALQGLYVDVSQLATLVNDEAAVALGVIRGFNSSDGD